MGFKTFASAPVGVGPITSPGAASGTGPGEWHPTVLWMLALVLAEIILAGFLSRNLLR